MRRQTLCAAMLFFAWSLWCSPSLATVYDLNLVINPADLASAFTSTSSNFSLQGRFSDYGISPITLLPGDSIDYSMMFTGGQALSVPKPSANTRMGGDAIFFLLKTDLYYADWGPDTEQSASIYVDVPSGSTVQPNQQGNVVGDERVFYFRGPVEMPAYGGVSMWQLGSFSFSGINGVFTLDNIYNPTIYVNGVGRPGPFTSLTLTNFYFGAFEAASVPEPESWVMMLVGMLALGAVLRASRRARFAGGEAPCSALC